MGIPVTEVRTAAEWKKARVDGLPRFDRRRRDLRDRPGQAARGPLRRGGRGHQQVPRLQGRRRYPLGALVRYVRDDRPLRQGRPDRRPGRAQDRPHLPARGRARRRARRRPDRHPAGALRRSRAEARAGRGERPPAVLRKTQKGHPQGHLRPCPRRRRVGRQVGRGRAGRTGRAAHRSGPGHGGHGRRGPAVDRPDHGRAHDRAARGDAREDDRRGRARPRPRLAQGQRRRPRRARPLDQRFDGRVRPRPARQDQVALRHRRRRAEHRRREARGSCAAWPVRSS